MISQMHSREKRIVVATEHLLISEYQKGRVRDGSTNATLSKGPVE